MATKEEKMQIAREKAARRAEKKQRKGDAPYLNSIGRVTSRIMISAIEFVLVFILVSLFINYMQTGSIDINTLPDTVSTYLQPGGVIFTALVAFLPIIVLENIGIYFGLGTVPRMAFGIIKYLALIWWLHVLTGSAGDIDIVQMSGLSGSSLMGVESVTVNLTPLVKLLDIILLLCCIIPVGEFIGCRRRHNDAVIRLHDRRYGPGTEESEEEGPVDTEDTELKEVAEEGSADTGDTGPKE